MKNTRKVIGLAVLAGLATAAQGQVSEVVFYEDFESYGAGSNIHGQGGWKGWFNTPSAGAQISTAQSTSGSRSVAIAGNPGSDLVHEFNYTSGQYRLSINQYIPSATTGTTYLILMNRYNDQNQNLNWSIQSVGTLSGNMEAGGGSGGVGATGATAAIPKDQWVQWVFDINLDANRVQEYYNGQPFGPEHPWQATGANALGAIDLYSENVGPVYYDDLKIERIPEPSVLALIGLGGIALGLRRRSS